MRISTIRTFGEGAPPPQQADPRRALRPAMTSPLLDLPDDLWHQLSRHLPPSAIFTLLQTCPQLHSRLRPLLPALSPNLLIGLPDLHDAILAALRADHHLAFFLLHLAPPFSPICHPLLPAFHDAALADSLPPPLVRRLVAHFLLRSCIASLFQILEGTSSIPVLLTVCSLPLAPPYFIARLIQTKTLRGDSRAAQALLVAHPHTASVSVSRPSCAFCAARHTLLHTAAEIGDVDVVQATLDSLHQNQSHLLNARDCEGETPLSVAIRRRRSRVAQQLVRGGAEVRELVGCAARGGGALDAGDVWFKPVVDVD